jgi:PAS domain S-box-containing protein
MKIMWFHFEKSEYFPFIVLISRMSPKNFIFRLLVLLSVLLPGAAVAEQLPLKVYTSADGLATGSVFHIFRDSRGFLWFSTRAGLARFDGHEFVNYLIEGQGDSPVTNSSVETRDGSFWIATNNGIYRLKPDDRAAFAGAENTAQKSDGFQFLKAEKVANSVVRMMFEDSRGRLWGGDRELFLLAENGEVKAQKFDLGEIARTERGFGVVAFYETADGSVWFGCESGAMRLLPDGRRVLYPIKRQTGYDATSAIAEDAEGRIWVGHSSGAFVFKPETLVALDGAADLSIRPFTLEEKIISASGEVALPNETGKMLRLMFTNDRGNSPGTDFYRQTLNIERLFRSFDGKIWIPVTGSFFAFDRQHVERLSDEDGFPGVVSTLAEDAEKNIWIGTQSGAVRFNRRGMTSWGLADGLVEPRVHSVFESKDGSIYVVHGDWLASRVKTDGIETVSLKVPYGDRFMWTSPVGLLDSANNWWMLSSNGLYRFDAAPDPASLNGKPAAQVFGQKDGFKTNSFYSIFEDSGGNMWFSTRDVAEKNGLARRDAKTGEFKFFTAADGLPDGMSVRAFAEDRSGNIWLGMYTGGFVRYKNGRFTDFSKSAGAPAGPIIALYVDRKNRLWLGSTSVGLAVTENPNDDAPAFKIYSTAEGLTSNNIRAITGDFHGNIYAGTISGVDRLNPETGAVRHYSPADGLASDTVTSAFCDRLGRVWFGTLNGLSRLDEMRGIEEQIAESKVVINTLQIAGNNYAVSPFGSESIGNLALNSSENNLQIQFLSVGSGRRYQYKLEGGGSKDWSAPRPERIVNFAGLAPGEYTFFVRAVDSVGNPSAKTASISFSIAPPFWRTRTFIVAVILIVALGVFLLDRYRVAKTRQVESALAKSLESERIARESETRFRTLAETASDAIITIDTESRIVFVNEAVEKIFGWRAEELLGENLTVLMPDEFRKRHENGLNRYASTGTRSIPWNGIELAGRHRSGFEIPIEISFGEFDLDGKHYFTGVARDISERCKAEEALRRSREERLAELEKVRTRIATDLHDDIGSSLTQITVLTEVARRQAVLETVRTPLMRISDVSNELVDAMADIVWAINPKKDSLRELVLRMRRFASDVLAARDIEFEFEAPEELDKISLGANIRREVFAIFKESVNNIVRHSGASEVFINFEADENRLRLEIVDDGQGFDTAEILSEKFMPEKGGNGLANMRRRAGELGGTCEISSTRGKTTIRLDIPLHATQDGEDIHITQASGAGNAAIQRDSDAGGGNGLH